MSNSLRVLPDYLRCYLDNIEMPSHYTYYSVPCEICGSSELEVIQDIVDIGKCRFGYLPVHGCLNCGYVFHAQRFEEQFYRDFYETHYRSVLFGRTKSPI